MFELIPLANPVECNSGFSHTRTRSPGLAVALAGGLEILAFAFSLAATFSLCLVSKTKCTSRRTGRCCPKKLSSPPQDSMSSICGTRVSSDAQVFLPNGISKGNICSGKFESGSVRLIQHYLLKHISPIVLATRRISSEKMSCVQPLHYSTDPCPRG